MNLPRRHFRPNDIIFVLGCLTLALWLGRELLFGPSLLATLIVAVTTYFVVRTAEPALPGDDTL